jgi:hypothetical protein
MANIVQMDYGTVSAVASGFKQQQDALTAIGQGLKAAIEVLRAAAFFSLGITQAIANYLEGIMNAVNNLAKICGEFSGDLTRAVSDHKSGDYKGGTYFRGGIEL